MKNRSTLVLGLLRLLRSRYPDLVEEKELCEYQDVLIEPLGIIAPAPKITKKGNQSSDMDYLAKVAAIRATNYIELYKGTPNPDPAKNIPNRYKITLKGIEFLSQVELQKSSERLESLTHILYVFTALLAIFALSQIILTTNNEPSKVGFAIAVSAGVIFIALILVAIIVALARWVYKQITRN